MTQSLAEAVVVRPAARASAMLEFPQSRPIRDMQRVTALFRGLLQDGGHVIQFVGQSANREIRIDTSELKLCVAAADTTLAVHLERPDLEDGRLARCVELLLARLVRATCQVLRPSGIRWLDRDRSLPIDIWLSAFCPVKPRRVRITRRTGSTMRPARAGVRVWPDRPEDTVDRHSIALQQSRQDATAQRFEDWHPAATPRAENRFPAEPLPYRLSAWALTGVTTALCPPAGASLAILNVAKRANLRLNLHALTLTVVILALQQSGAVAELIRATGL